MVKMILIGGGENGRILENGEKTLYETEIMDKEIIKLTEKKQPNYLFINHAMSFSDKIQEDYYQTMKKIYKDKFGCNCKDLKSYELTNIDIVNEKLEWADIIYEGGGDTETMISLWKKTDFDKKLYKAFKSGKVISGISAGAVCWFNECNSESDSTFKTVKCLNWFDLFITPHCDEKGRYESTKEQLKRNGKIGLMLSNRSALEIIDNKYRIIFNDSDKDKKPYVIKAYWDNGIYKEKHLYNTKELLPIKDLLSKDI